MEETLLVRLTRARRDHPLRMFATVPAGELDKLGHAAPVDDPGRLPTVRYTAAAP